MSRLSDFIPGVETADGRRRDSFRVIDADTVEYNGERFRVGKAPTVIRSSQKGSKNIKRLRLELEALDD